MKSFLLTLMGILESMGRARAAATLARQGNYEAAQDLMLNGSTEKKSC